MKSSYSQIFSSPHIAQLTLVSIQEEEEEKKSSFSVTEEKTIIKYNDNINELFVWKNLSIC
jgi:hypothetical protein